MQIYLGKKQHSEELRCFMLLAAANSKISINLANIWSHRSQSFKGL